MFPETSDPSTTLGPLACFATVPIDLFSRPKTDPNNEGTTVAAGHFDNQFGRFMQGPRSLIAIIVFDLLHIFGNTIIL